MVDTIKLNDQQKAIVTTPLDKNMRIIACAGSGKTTTILYRIKHLIDSKIPENRIILTTFNVDSAQNLKNRLYDIFGYQPKLFVGTIDSIAYRFYKMYFQKKNFIGVSEYTNELLNFLKSDNKNKILDKFSYFFFDEFQDINNIQFDIIKEFSNNGCKIVVIGDDAQNIYQWRGSNIDYILNFDKYIDNVKTYKLEHNYRSTPEIVNFANDSINNNLDQISKNMISTKPSINHLPEIRKFKSDLDTNDFVINKILKFKKDGIKLDEICIMSRNSFGLKSFEESIEKYNLENYKDNPEDKLLYVSLLNDSDKVSKPVIEKDSICITTIHKSKGLEFEVVFLIDCDDKQIPCDITPIILEEERRLFYVAVTRSKKYLYICFKSPHCSRFIAELDDTNYNFVNFKTSYYDYKNNRNVKIKLSVVDLINNLSQENIKYIREKDLLPDLHAQVTQVHSKTSVDDYIIKHNFQADYGTYIDRIISFKFSRKDPVADIVIGSLQLSSFEFIIFQKYQANIIYKYVINCNVNSIDKTIDDPDVISKIEIKDKQILSLILKKINVKMNELKLIHISQMYICPDSFLPKQFIDEMNKIYMKFRNNNEINNRDLYKLSLCGNIYDSRKRLLYRDVFDQFDNNKKIYDNINSWCEKYKSHKTLIKEEVYNFERNIIGEIDMIDLTESTIIDFKTSASECNLDWILQLLVYKYLYEQMNANVIIKYIKIYNPLNGTEITFNVEKWNVDTSEELISYLKQIRSERYNRNKKVKNDVKNDVKNNKGDDVKKVKNISKSNKTIYSDFFDDEETERLFNQM
jgi:hypothetical protein